MKNLVEIFKKYDILLKNEQADAFDKFFHMLIDANQHVNLTAITEEEEVLFKHFLDSVLPQKIFTKNASVVDVGTGAGFPGIPLKIVRDDLDITLVDSLNKRVIFLNDVISNLNLKKISAVHARAEDFAKNNRQKFDYAVARAVASLPTLLEYLLPLLKLGGKAVIYKSFKLDEELETASNALKILGGKIETVLDFTIDEKDLNRKILIVKKIEPTPKTYPRDKNKPKLSPL